MQVMIINKYSIESEVYKLFTLISLNNNCNFMILCLFKKKVRVTHEKPFLEHNMQQLKSLCVHNGAKKTKYFIRCVVDLCSLHSMEIHVSFIMPWIHTFQKFFCDVIVCACIYLCFMRVNVLLSSPHCFIVQKLLTVKELKYFIADLWRPLKIGGKSSRLIMRSYPKGSAIFVWLNNLIVHLWKILIRYTYI